MSQLALLSYCNLPVYVFILFFLSFQEPQLGTSWYHPSGPTPTFLSNQANGSRYTSRLGDDALLSCKVTSLERDLVSWVRRDETTGHIPVVLTVGFKPHSSENRFILDFEPPNNYRLRIQNVQWRDEGIYLCQLSIHPPSLMWSRLELVRPVVHLLDGDSNPVVDLHYDSGTSIEMVCRVRRPPRYHVSIQWEFVPLNRSASATSSSPSSGKRKNLTFILNRDVTRGGVKVDTGRDEDSGFVISRLTLDKARVGDTGNFTCRLLNLPEEKSRRKGLSDTISVHVLKGENSEAIYSRCTTTIQKRDLPSIGLSVTWTLSVLAAATLLKEAG